LGINGTSGTGLAVYHGSRSSTVLYVSCVLAIPQAESISLPLFADIRSTELFNTFKHRLKTKLFNVASSEYVRMTMLVVFCLWPGMEKSSFF